MRVFEMKKYEMKVSHAKFNALVNFQHKVRRENEDDNMEVKK